MNLQSSICHFLSRASAAPEKIIVLALALLAACTHLEPPPNRPVEDWFNLRYDVTQAGSIGLSNVFEDHRRTYLQFANQEVSPPVAIAPLSGQHISFVKQGSYWVAEGVFAALSISAAGKYVVVTNQAVSNRASTSPTVPPAVLLQPTSAPSAVVTAMTTAPGAQPITGQIPPLPFIVEFAYLRHELTIKARSQIVAFARALPAESRVVVAGYTATTPLNVQGEALARARASSVRDALIEGGLSNGRVTAGTLPCPSAEMAEPRPRAACQRATIVVAPDAQNGVIRTSVSLMQ